MKNRFSKLFNLLAILLIISYNLFVPLGLGLSASVWADEGSSEVTTDNGSGDSGSGSGSDSGGSSSGDSGQQAPPSDNSGSGNNDTNTESPPPSGDNSGSDGQDSVNDDSSAVEPPTPTPMPEPEPESTPQPEAGQPVTETPTPIQSGPTPSPTSGSSSSEDSSEFDSSGGNSSGSGNSGSGSNGGSQDSSDSGSSGSGGSEDNSSGPDSSGSSGGSSGPGNDSSGSGSGGSGGGNQESDNSGPGNGDEPPADEPLAEEDPPVGEPPVDEIPSDSGGVIGDTGTSDVISTDPLVAGIIDLNNGFPLFYSDALGTAVVACLDGSDPGCVLPGAGEEPNFDPADPTVFPDNFPSEFFYWIAESDPIQTPNGGKTFIRTAVEGAFLNEDPAPGDQTVFGRIRVTGTGLEPNSIYTVTHPYGVDTYQTNDVGVVRRPDGTEDIGCEVRPCDFALALGSRVFDGFLRMVSGAPVGYLGDGVTAGEVVGSPLGQNFFRIEGPGLPLEGLFTNLFTVAGKLFDGIVPPQPPVGEEPPVGEPEPPVDLGDAAAGPIDQANGFPISYQDALGTAVAACLDGTDPGCVLPGAGEEPNFDPAEPTVFPDNFPSEFFYWIAESDLIRIPETGGKFLFRMAVEGAFLNDDPAPGDQMVFGRLRATGTGLEPNSIYTVTHPYGVDTYETNDVGVIRRPVGTEDIGCEVGPCDFSLALFSRVFQSFLRWDSGAPEGYLGDAVTPHTVTGSPIDNNFVRIEGPGLPLEGLFTNLFTVAGKLFAGLINPPEEPVVPEPPTGGEPPVDEEPPADDSPVGEPPIDEEPPSDQPPADQPPADEPPTNNEPPANENPGDDSNGDDDSDGSTTNPVESGPTPTPTPTPSPTPEPTPSPSPTSTPNSGDGSNSQPSDNNSQTGTGTQTSTGSGGGTSSSSSDNTSSSSSNNSSGGGSSTTSSDSGLTSSNNQTAGNSAENPALVLAAQISQDAQGTSDDQLDQLAQTLPEAELNEAAAGEIPGAGTANNPAAAALLVVGTLVAAGGFLALKSLMTLKFFKW